MHDRRGTLCKLVDWYIAAATALALDMAVASAVGLASGQAISAGRNPRGDTSDKRVLIDYASPEGSTMKVLEAPVHSPSPDSPSPDGATGNAELTRAALVVFPSIGCSRSLDVAS